MRRALALVVLVLLSGTPLVTWAGGCHDGHRVRERMLPDGNTAWLCVDCWHDVQAGSGAGGGEMP